MTATPADLAAQLLEVSANLQDHIEARAQEIAAPRIQAAEDNAEQKVTDLMARHDSEVQRLKDLVAELRRQIKPLARAAEQAAQARRAARQAEAEQAEAKQLIEAAEIVIKSPVGAVNTTWIQRHVYVGFAQAQRLLDQLKGAGVVGPLDIRGQHRVLMASDQLETALLAVLQRTPDAEAGP